ncbi:TIGR03986 family CRISPR-associated RAMP protein [Haloimpatiens sp. FM7330]|uniref:TIGR03986 family type III CRISPR-associated RAMP protein n=1 Tax=Haloimpatiens sp. FM7330 TaxID=3298610 RepID=UPI003632C36D
MKDRSSSYLNKNSSEKYAKAPYNFIPFPEKIFYRHTLLKNCENEDKGIDILPKHDEFKLGLKTGYIDYSVKVETPLFISDGNKDFFRVNGDYVIPGSTVRGKVRSNAEILSCSYPEFVEDKKLWFRGAFSKDVLKKMYTDAVLSGETGNINEKVKAGYLCRKDNKWFVIPAKKDKNGKYFREIHESMLRKQYKTIDENIRSNIFMYEFRDKHSREELWYLIKDKKNKKKEINRKIKNKEKELSKNEKNKFKYMVNDLQNEIEALLKHNERKGFKPYYYKALYCLKENNSPLIKKVVKSINDDDYGILMNSSRLNHKQNHYLIFKKDNDKKEKIVSQDLINQYKTSVKYRQAIEVENFEINKDNDFVKGKEKPIFYITDKEDNIISFGFTPYLKVTYKKSVKDGIKTNKENCEEMNKGNIDYAKSIFGFTNLSYSEGTENKTKSYKGRVSFTNVKSAGNCNQIKKPILKHLMNPKISSFQLYLKQNTNNPKKLKTYSSDDFELRGEKFYWLRHTHDDKDEYKKGEKAQQYAVLYPVDKGAIFKGRIYFENLYEDELGLLLMSIKPFEDAKENLGQGKPYGYGKVKFEIDDIVEIDSQDRFISLNMNSSKKSIMGSKNDCIGKFKDYMKKQNINVDFDNEYMYKCFSYSKSKTRDICEPEFNYMRITDFKNRKILKPVEKYIDEDKEMTSQEQAAVTKEEDESELDKDSMRKRLSIRFKIGVMKK